MQESPKRQIYRFADVEVDAVRGRLVRGGEVRRLRQKTFQVLVYLLEHGGGVVTKDELRSEVWQNTSVVDDVLVQSIKDIRRALGDDPFNPHYIKTIPKSGYRFIGELEEEGEKGKRRKEESDEDTRSPEAQSRGSAPRVPVSALRRRPLLTAIIVLVVVSLGLVFANRMLLTGVEPRAEIRLPQTPGKKTLAVMFFENQSRDAELDWLREGLADMLIAGLSRSPSLTVLSRGQLHLLLERAKPDAAAKKIELDEALEIASRTGAEAVVTGSFTKIGETVRLDIQLYDARTGALSAVESLTLERAEQILTEIDSLSLKLAARLGAPGSGGEAGRGPGLAAVMTDNLEAYRYYSLAVEKAQGLHNKEAIGLLERAVALDPDFAMAHARIGYAYAVTWGRAAEGKPHLEKAFQLSTRLTEKDRLNIAAWYAIANLDYPAAIPVYQEIISKYPAETEAYWRLGRLLLGEEQYDEALRILKQGLAVDPDARDIYNSLSVTYRDMHRHAESIAMAERYVLLAPKEPNAYDTLALAHQAAGQYEKAEAAYKQALQLNPNFDVAVLHLGNLYFQTGRYSRAVGFYETYVGLAESDWDKAWGWGRIAWVNLRWGKLAKAAAAADKELKLDGNSFASSLVVALEQGDAEKAARLRRRLSEPSVYTERGLRPSVRRFYFLRGFSALKNDQPEEALQNFRDLLKHRPMVWDIDSFEDCLARAYLELGRFDEAVAEFERLLRLNPDYPLARFYLARALERKGSREEARALYRQFLENWKHADQDIPEIAAARKLVSES